MKGFWTSMHWFVAPPEQELHPLPAGWEVALEREGGFPWDDWPRAKEHGAEYRRRFDCGHEVVLLRIEGRVAQVRMGVDDHGRGIDWKFRGSIGSSSLRNAAAKRISGSAFT